MQRQSKGAGPAMQRINQTVSPIVQELEWIKTNSPSVKAIRQAGKAILQYELAEIYADRAFTSHETKELKQQKLDQQEVRGSYNRKQQHRFQGQES